MESFRFARGLFQIFALGLFVYQFQNSIFKYISAPIVQQTSTTTFDEIKKPIIYLCQDGQFDYNKSRSYGYKSSTTFTRGTVTGIDGFSWNGKDGNLSFKEIQDRIVKYDYTNVLPRHSHTGDGDAVTWDRAQTEKIALVPLGTCLEILQIRRETRVDGKETTDLYIVDSRGINNFSIFGFNVAKAYFGPIDKDHFELKNYEVEITLHDLKIHDGRKCTDYERIGSSYAECYEKEFRKRLLDWYGCLPPWYNNGLNLTCQDGTVIHVDETIAAKIKDQMRKFVNAGEMDFLELCLPPCLSMSFKLTELGRISTMLNNAAINFRIKDEILVQTNVYAYDVFSLVVDLGSSLGLWLGLSALSIFDTLVEFFLSVKSKYNH